MAKGTASLNLAPQGKLYIDKAAEVHSLLTDAFRKASVIVLNWDAVEDIELPVLQLLYAARKEAAETGKAFHFTGKVSERVSSRLLKSGFLREIPSSGEALEAGLLDFSGDADAR